MDKKNWMLLLLLLSSLFLVSCKEKETNINETADFLINTTETLREDTEYAEPECKTAHCRRRKQQIIFGSSAPADCAVSVLTAV